MAFRKTLDLEVHRKTFVTFGQWLRSNTIATTIQLVKTLSVVVYSGFAIKSK